MSTSDESVGEVESLSLRVVTIESSKGTSLESDVRSVVPSAPSLDDTQDAPSAPPLVESPSQVLETKGDIHTSNPEKLSQSRQSSQGSQGRRQYPPSQRYDIRVDGAKELKAGWKEFKANTQLVGAVFGVVGNLGYQAGKAVVTRTPYLWGGKRWGKQTTNDNKKEEEIDQDLLDALPGKRRR